jgi:hypothetical protein
MSLKPPSFKRLALILLVIAPLAAWWLVKPVRVLAPGLVGIDCSSGPVCVEDPAQLGVAEQLYGAAVADVGLTISPLAGAPLVIFCSSEACAESFGLGERSAVTLGTAGTVIGPRAWKPYYLRHELIHHLQGQRLGVLRRSLLPAWFVEGMAYSLSQDPRAPLAEPWESHRRRFAAWYGSIAKDQLWEAAGKL